jgi:intein/homing endonuclease
MKVMKSEFKVRSYLYVIEVIESYEDEKILNDFKNKFEEGKEIEYKDYFEFCNDYIDDVSETYYIDCNWNNEYDY